jgi:hypothetical protein
MDFAVRRRGHGSGIWRCDPHSLQESWKAVHQLLDSDWLCLGQGFQSLQAAIQTDSRFYD